MQSLVCACVSLSTGDKLFLAVMAYKYTWCQVTCTLPAMFTRQRKGGGGEQCGLG